MATRLTPATQPLKERLAWKALEHEQTPSGVTRLARKAAASFARRVEQVNDSVSIAAGKQIGSVLAVSACKRFGIYHTKGAGIR